MSSGTATSSLLSGQGCFLSCSWAEKFPSGQCAVLPLLPEQGKHLLLSGAAAPKETVKTEAGPARLHFSLWADFAILPLSQTQYTMPPVPPLVAEVSPLPNALT